MSKERSNIATETLVARTRTKINGGNRLIARGVLAEHPTPPSRARLRSYQRVIGRLVLAFGIGSSVAPTFATNSRPVARIGVPS